MQAKPMTAKTLRALTFSLSAATGLIWSTGAANAQKVREVTFVIYTDPSPAPDSLEKPVVALRQRLREDRRLICLLYDPDSPTFIMAAQTSTPQLTLDTGVPEFERGMLTRSAGAPFYLDVTPGIGSGAISLKLIRVSQPEKAAWTWTGSDLAAAASSLTAVLTAPPPAPGAPASGTAGSGSPSTAPVYVAPPANLPDLPLPIPAQTAPSQPLPDLPLPVPPTVAPAAPQVSSPVPTTPTPIAPLPSAGASASIVQQPISAPTIGQPSVAPPPTLQVAPPTPTPAIAPIVAKPNVVAVSPVPVTVPAAPVSAPASAMQSSAPQTTATVPPSTTVPATAPVSSAPVATTTLPSSAPVATTPLPTVAPSTASIQPLSAPTSTGQLSTTQVAPPVAVTVIPSPTATSVAPVSPVTAVNSPQVASSVVPPAVLFPPSSGSSGETTPDKVPESAPQAAPPAVQVQITPLAPVSATVNVVAITAADSDVFASDHAPSRTAAPDGHDHVMSSEDARKEVIAGDLAMQSSDLFGAITDYRAAINLAPFATTVRLKLADAYVQANHPKQAVDEAQRALMLDPDNDAVTKYIQDLETKGLISDSDATVQLAAVSRDPENASAWIELGDTYVQSSQMDKAVEAYKHAEALQPSMADSQVHLIRVFAALGQYDKAADAAQNAGAAGYMEALRIVQSQSDNLTNRLQTATDAFTQGTTTREQFYKTISDIDSDAKGYADFVGALIAPKAYSVSQLHRSFGAKLFAQSTASWLTFAETNSSDDQSAATQFASDSRREMRIAASAEEAVAGMSTAPGI